MRTWCPNR